MTTPQMPNQLPPRKGLSPIAWILIIVGGLFTIVLVVLIAGGLFLAHKVKQAGFDPALMQRNPALAVTKIITTANPNAEVLSVDEGSGTIRIRDKQNGKTFTMNFADVKSGKIVFQEDGKEAATVTMAGSTDGKSGTVEVKTSDGVTKIGAGTASAPAWLPTYPGSQPEGLLSTDTADARTGTFAFTTKDSLEKVTDFYKDRFKSAGLKVASTTTNESDGKVSGGMTAEDEAKKRSVLMGYYAESDGTKVTLSFKESK